MAVGLFQVKAQVSVIRTGQNLRLRYPVQAALFLDDAHKGIFGRHTAVSLPQIFGGNAGFDGGMRSCENATHQIYRRHRQRHIRQAEFLDDFARVTVPVGGERPDHPGPFRVVCAGVALCAALGGTHFEFDDDLFIQIDQAGFDQRHQSQVAGSGIATHAAGIMGAAQLVPVQFG